MQHTQQPFAEQGEAELDAAGNRHCSGGDPLVSLLVHAASQGAEIGAFSNGALVTISVTKAELNMASSDILAAIPPGSDIEPARCNDRCLAGIFPQPGNHLSWGAFAVRNWRIR